VRNQSIQPATRYARSGDIRIAYQVFGEGPINVVLAPPFVSSIENYWDEPDAARWLLRLGSYARVVMLDKRGTGMSDACCWHLVTVTSGAVAVLGVPPQVRLRQRSAY
jgi:pimeloyl-ACP methyl ester carboxylesterase